MVQFQAAPARVVRWTRGLPVRMMIENRRAGRHLLRRSSL
jgi:hypothetical protein